MADRFWGSRFAWVCLAAACNAAAASHVASASTYKVLHSFCQQSNCADGQVPVGALAEDAAGNLYGVTSLGGDNASGVIYELVENADGSAYSYKRLYSFCVKTHCPDGSRPSSGVVVDVQGNVFGTAAALGSAGKGTVFELSADGSYSVIHTFCKELNCLDGKVPGPLEYSGRASGKLYDGESPLYGLTIRGGVHNAGIAYQLVRDGGEWTETTLYNFCSQRACADGSRPAASLSVEASGTLVGTAHRGGQNRLGAVFRLEPQSGSWTEGVVHSFCQKEECTDGGGPVGNLVEDSAQQIFGTAVTGLHLSRVRIKSIIFKMKQDGSEYGRVYTFCSERKCLDGDEAVELTLDPGGNLFGVTARGGASDWGTLYEIKDSQHTVLYNFCSVGRSCRDGQFPVSAPLVDASGNIFGVTESGGANGRGVVYEFTP